MIRLSLAILTLVFSASAHGKAAGGPELRDISLVSNSGHFSVEAKAPLAFIGSIDQILAAENVVVKVREGERTKDFECASFTHHIRSQLTFCEVRKSRTSIAVDIRNEKITYYPAK